MSICGKSVLGGGHSPVQRSWGSTGSAVLENREKAMWLEPSERGRDGEAGRAGRGQGQVLQGLVG